ncbi:MAG: hypothetical protein OXL36_00390 [Bryobacterales bacterium]|nr:hypothetical protein [Bryobacterales bacterium]
MKDRDSCRVKRGDQSRPSSGDWGWEPLSQAVKLAGASRSAGESFCARAAAICFRAANP